MSVEVNWRIRLVAQNQQVYQIFLKVGRYCAAERFIEILYPNSSVSFLNNNLTYQILFDNFSDAVPDDELLVV